ncbi:MAG: hypothetical protein KH449_01985 [Lachnospiraceae bacterium]|jgi:hypothetical protein|nr:hypothetical protein [Lachnospiraceae bacterium]
MVVTYDLYKELELERAWDEKTIKSTLKEIQRLWTKRQSACNDKEQLMLIENVLTKVGEGFKYLVKSLKRKEYDIALDKAYKNGQIKDETEAKMKSLIEEAKQYYRKGNIKLAAQCAAEAIEGKINDPAAYDLLARCYFDMQEYGKALKTLDAGTEIYTDNLDLYWLGARIATVGTQDYADAQQRVNKLIELAPDRSVGHSEQVYLHLHKGDENLAFQEIDTYIEAHPEDENFKRRAAYDINSYSNSCYYYDKAQNATFIANKESYEKCVKLRTKAAEIFKDEYTQKQLEDAQYFGKKEWNSWNIESIKSLSIYGLILLFIFPYVGVPLLIIDALLIYFSFRPYWQINKSYVTGEMGELERIISSIGDYAARFGGWFIRFLWNAAIAILKFCMGIASGRFFK